MHGELAPRQTRFDSVKLATVWICEERSRLLKDCATTMHSEIRRSEGAWVYLKARSEVFYGFPQHFYPRLQFITGLNQPRFVEDDVRCHENDHLATGVIATFDSE